MALCDVCSKADFLSLFNLHYHIGDYVADHNNLQWDLKNLPNNPCAFCSLLEEIIGWSDISNDTADLKIEYDGWVPRPVRDFEEHRLWAPTQLCFRVFGVQRDTSKRVTFDLPVRLLPLPLHPEDVKFPSHYGDNESDEISQENCQGHARIINNDYLNMGLLRSWITSCEIHHGDNCDGVGRDPTTNHFPEAFRLIDVLEGCIVKVGESHDYIYLALSYVWVKSRPQSVLTTKNCNLWSAPGSLFSPDLDFSDAIFDAMALTRLLGQRYLWIDALCILQDSETEKVAQVSRMDHIYRLAWLVVVAAADSDTEGMGLLGLPNRPRKNVHQTTAQVGNLTIATVNASPYDVLENSKWNTRAWTLQEKLCSRRSLVFTEAQVLFWCTKAVYREDIYMEHPDFESLRIFEPLNSLYSKKSDDSESVARIPDKIFDDQYAVVLANYLSRALSYPEDIINAFTGIAESLHPDLGRFHCGLPEKVIQRALSWRHHATFRRRFGFPTWSWAGWYHDQGYPDHTMYYRGQEFRPTITIFMYNKLMKQLEVIGDKKDTEQPIDATRPENNEILHLLKAQNNQLLVFTTEVAVLHIQPSPKKRTRNDGLKKYSVTTPDGHEFLGDIVLDPEWADCRTGLDQEFLHICPHTDVDNKATCLLMLFYRASGIAYRIQISEIVDVSRWLACPRHKELIILG